MVPTNSHLNDLMYDYYQTLNSRDAGNRLYGPITIASSLSGLTTGQVHSFPYPDKTLFGTLYYVCHGPITAGTIAFESAWIAGFTGTWHALETKQFSGGTAAGVSVSSFQNGPHFHVRPRVTAAIVGGTIDMFWVSA